MVLKLTDFAESPTGDAEATAIMLQMSEVTETMLQLPDFFYRIFCSFFFLKQRAHRGQLTKHHWKTGSQDRKPLDLQEWQEAMEHSRAGPWAKLACIPPAGVAGWLQRSSTG